MATTKEAPTSKKPSKVDIITPYRFTLAVLIRNFCKFRNSDEYKAQTGQVQAKYRRDFSVLILKLIQSPDLTLDELWNILVSKKFMLTSSFIKQFEQDICVDMGAEDSGTGNMLDFIDSLNSIMKFNEVILIEPNSFIICKSSTIGYYLRRLIVNFDKLNFSEVTQVYYAFKRYLKVKNISYFPSENKMYNLDECRSGEKDIWSKRQAELYVATQAALLNSNEEKAQNPKDMQQTIANVLKTNPELAEAHFLSYLNSLRVREFCGAVDSLYHCFDGASSTETKGDDKLKSYRSAALNLAILHYQFGHREEALASLKEAIKISQEANDNICLQQALSWLYRITKINKDKLIEHSILKSFELNLSYTTSLGLQTFVQMACLICGNPYQIFETLLKSDLINVQDNHRDLISNSYAVKSSVWQFYGKPEMSSLWSQMLLHLNIDNPKPNKSFNGESFCLSVCNVANFLLMQGEYNLVHCILSFAKEKFPNEPNASTWQMCENIFIFIRALYHQNWNVAEAAAQKIVVLDKWEGYLRLAELYYHKQDFAEADKCLNILLEHHKSNEKYRFKGYYIIRAKILQAEIQISSNTTPTGIMDVLVNCMVDTKKYQMEYYSALIQLCVAHMQLSMGMTSQALKVLDKCLMQILAHGGNYDRARCILLYAKCLIADSAKLDSVERKNTFFKCTKMLDGCRINFEKVEAYSRVKDVLFLQAQLYNLLNLKAERNKCSLDFRVLDEEYPSKNVTTLVKFI